jgi:hypothetical protein
MAHKIYQRLSLQDTSKFTHIGIFGLKIYHLTTLQAGMKIIGKTKLCSLGQ